MGGWVCQPISHGADIVVADSKAWLCGHGTASGGVVIDGGTGEWGSARYPGMSEPHPGYHGESSCVLRALTPNRSLVLGLVFDDVMGKDAYKNVCLTLTPTPTLTVPDPDLNRSLPSSRSP